MGNSYTRRGYHEKGLAIDLRLTQLRGEDPLTWYNLACSYSLLNRADDSLNALRRAIEFGYSDFDYLRRDPDLALLRQSAQYRQFIEALAAKISQAHTNPDPTPPVA